MYITGFHNIDKNFEGFKPSELVIVGGISSIGKTSFMVSLLKNLSVDFKIPSTYFNFQSSNEVLMNRLLANITGIELKKFLGKNFNEIEFQKISISSSELEVAPFLSNDSSNHFSIEDFKIRCVNSIRTNDSKFIFIDNLIGLHFSIYNNDSNISKTIQDLKNIAKELNIIIIVTSTIDNNNSTIPKLTDFPEKTKIEKFADIILLINRPEFHKIYNWENDESCLNQAEIIIAKNNSSKNTTSAIIYFDKDLKKFQNSEVVNSYVPSNSVMEQIYDDVDDDFTF